MGNSDFFPIEGFHKRSIGEICGKAAIKLYKGHKKKTCINGET